MKKYVINMLAKPEAITTSQMKSIANVDKAMEIYLKNSLTCLASLKIHNPDVECILFINFELSAAWKEQFENFSIKTIFLEFGNFKIDEEFNWGIVQYRYDVMQYLSNNLLDDDCVIMLDTDIVCVGNLKNAFTEIEHSVLLYDVQLTLINENREKIIKNYLRLFPNDTHCELTVRGGEFIGANGFNLRRLFEECKKIMSMSSTIDSLEDFNDEHITSIAIYRNWNTIPVNNANPYIFRYWTGLRFYLASTNWYYNKVVLWHVPAEKNAGMIWLYKKLSKNKRLPSDKKIARRFGFPSNKRSNMIPFIIANFHKILKTLTK